MQPNPPVSMQRRILLALCLPMLGIVTAVAYLFALPGAAEAEVTIDAPIEAVWTYVGDSRSAEAWSVYFHHITPRRTSADGTPGALRTCYRRADETGIRWDERTTAVEQAGDVWTRRLRTFNLRGFRGVAGLLAPHTAYDVEQRYVRLDKSRTSVCFRAEAASPNGLLRLLFRPYAREVERVFRLNLENIKAAVEAQEHGRRYRRPHPYWTAHPLD